VKPRGNAGGVRWPDQPTPAGAPPAQVAAGLVPSLKQLDETVPQPWDRLGGWLASRGRSLNTDVPPRQFAGGLANLNYLIVVDGAMTVLRRPPDGPIAEGANDMSREARVLSRLADRYPLAPRCLEFCADDSVLGAPFQLLEYRAGEAVRAELPAALAERDDAPQRLTSGLVHAMATLHTVDPAAVALGDLGKPEGFLRRQVEGWSRRCDAAYEGAVPPAATALVERLRQLVPDRSDTALVHGDLKFDNMLFDLHRIEPVAVVDWDMATRGDPLFDLAVLLSYWVEPSDPPGLHDLRQVPSLAPGFATRKQVAADYFAESGRPAEDLSFHLALARLRLAVAWQQLYIRFIGGIFTDPRYADFGNIANAVLTWTIDSLEAT
jgi:aminoglycoside phosphotransferase (APT) family kinase protein